MASFKALAASLLLALAAASPLQSLSKRQSAVPFGTVITSCTVPGTVALTFDDGPYIYTEELLNLLASNGVKATFFLNGQNYANIYDYSSTVQRMVNEGHQVGSHTYVSPKASDYKRRGKTLIAVSNLQMEPRRSRNTGYSWNHIADDAARRRIGLHSWLFPPIYASSVLQLQ